MLGRFHPISEGGAAYVHHTEGSYLHSVASLALKVPSTAHIQEGISLQSLPSRNLCTTLFSVTTENWEQKGVENASSMSDFLALYPVLLHSSHHCWSRRWDTKPVVIIAVGEGGCNVVISLSFTLASNCKNTLISLVQQKTGLVRGEHCRAGFMTMKLAFLKGRKQNCFWIYPCMVFLGCCWMINSADVVDFDRCCLLWNSFSSFMLSCTVTWVAGGCLSLHKLKCN